MDDVDEIAVERAAYGEPLRLNKAERRAVFHHRGEVVARLTRQGYSGRQIGEHLGITERQVFRHRARLRVAT